MAEAPRGSDGYAWVAVENLGDGRNRIVSELHIRICDKDIFAAALFNEPTEANVVPGGVATVLSALYVMDIRFRKLANRNGRPTHCQTTQTKSTLGKLAVRFASARVKSCEL